MVPSCGVDLSTLVLGVIGPDIQWTIVELFSHGDNFMSVCDLGVGIT